jgi:hypothetical protein
MLGDIDDIRAMVARALETAALTQMDLDELDAEILRADDRGASWSERAELYRREAVLAGRRAGAITMVAGLAVSLAGLGPEKGDADDVPAT